MRKLSCLFLVLFALSSRHAIADERRYPAPSAAEETALRQSVHQQYSDMYVSGDPAAELRLAKTLYQAEDQAETSNQDYGLLCESRDAAASAGDLTTAEKICQTLVKKFDLTISAARVSMFKSAAGTAGVDTTDMYFAILVKAIDQALLSDEFEPARQMIETGTTVATTAQSAHWTLAMKTQQSQYDAQEKAYPLIKPSLDLLQQDPADPASNVIVGNYTCLVKHDWHHGLDLLSRGNDARLKALATMELHDPQEAGGQIAVADGWATQATRLPQQALAVQLHAYDWNLRTLLNATIDSQRKHVEAQLVLLTPLVADHRDTPALWFSVCDDLSHRAYTTSAIAGGTKATDTFQDVPRLGATLVGFDYGLAMAGNQQCVTYFQPIYNTPTGERVGPAFGKAYSKLHTVHAPDGYAIGAMRVYGSSGLNSITPLFMRIDRDLLNADDAQVGRRVGGPGGTLEILDGFGTPVIGVCGRQKDGYLGLGLVYSHAVKNG